MPEQKMEKDRNELPDGCRALAYGCSSGCAISVLVMAIGMWAVVAAAEAMFN